MWHSWNFICAFSQKIQKKWNLNKSNLSIGFTPDLDWWLIITFAHPTRMQEIIHQIFKKKSFSVFLQIRAKTVLMLIEWKKFGLTSKMSVLIAAIIAVVQSMFLCHLWWMGVIRWWQWESHRSAFWWPSRSGAETLQRVTDVKGNFVGLAFRTKYSNIMLKEKLLYSVFHEKRTIRIVIKGLPKQWNSFYYLKSFILRVCTDT